MARVTAFMSPSIDPKTRQQTLVERRGIVAKLYVGNYQETFVLQFRADSDDVECLAHYASGMKFGDLAPIKLRHARSYATLKDREAAKELIADIVANRGADNVREIMRRAPVINNE